MAGEVGVGTLIIISGLPGTGKTTIARQIETERGAVRLNPDEWMAALHIDLWDQDARMSIEALQWHLARRLLALGQTVIIEWGTWARTERDHLRESARSLGARVELIFLDLPIDELARRLSARQMEDPPITRAQLAQWSQMIERPTAAERALFDRSR